MKSSSTNPNLLLPFLFFVLPIISDAQKVFPFPCDTIIAKAVHWREQDKSQEHKYRIVVRSNTYNKVKLFTNGRLLFQDTIAKKIDHGCYSSCCKSDSTFIFEDFNENSVPLELIISRHDRCLITSFDLRKTTSLIQVYNSYEILEEPPKDSLNKAPAYAKDGSPIFEDQSIKLDYSKPEISIFQE